MPSLSPEASVRVNAVGKCWCVAVPQPYPIIVGGDSLLIAVSASTRVYAIGEAAAK